MIKWLNETLLYPMHRLSSINGDVVEFPSPRDLLSYKKIIKKK